MIKNFPIIGILAQYDERIKKYFISYAYVEWLKSYGCYVIYIDPRLNREELINIFNQTDGFVIPGGNEYPYDNNKTYNTTKIFFELAMQHGNYPILGICMGVQFMITYFSKKNWDIVKTTVNNTSTQSNLYVDLDKIDNSILMYIPIDYYRYKFFNFNHNHAITYDFFIKNIDLMKNFNILTITKCKNDKHLFISSIQSKIYPFFGLQWHPEKSNFELSPYQNINRQSESIIIGNSISSFFIEYCNLTNSTTSEVLFKKYNITKFKKELYASHLYQELENYDDPLYIYVLE